MPDIRLKNPSVTFFTNGFACLAIAPAEVVRWIIMPVL